MISFNEILNNALSLSEKERAIIAEKIILSLDSKIDKQSGKQWQKEIAKRVKEIDDGKTHLISWEQARKNIS